MLPKPVNLLTLQVPIKTFQLLSMVTSAIELLNFRVEDDADLDQTHIELYFISMFLSQVY